MYICSTDSMIALRGEKRRISNLNQTNSTSYIILQLININSVTNVYKEKFIFYTRKYIHNKIII